MVQPNPKRRFTAPLPPFYRARWASGFTLVELLIVVSILGILAAIVVPKYVNAQDEAVASALAGNVKMIRDQVSLYQAKNGAYPDEIDTTWFAGGIPEHPENDIGLALIQLNPTPGLYHPVYKVLKSGVIGAYFYGPSGISVGVD